MTVKGILKRAMQLIGAVAANEDPEPEEYATALEFFNDWLTGQDGLMPFYSSREEFSTVASQAEYTIGSGGDFDTARPISIDSAYIKDTVSGIEWPVDIIARNRYDAHGLKTTEARPYQAYYDPEYPLGKLYLFFVPDKVYTLRLNMRKQLAEYSNINDTFALPDPYRRAAVFNVAVEIAPVFGFAVPQDVAKTARQTLKIVKRINLSNNIDDVELDSALLGRSRRGKDSFYGG